MGQSLARVVPVLPPVLPPTTLGVLEGDGEEEGPTTFGSTHLEVVTYGPPSGPEEPALGVRFPDLGSLPPELALNVLRHLDATDLCLASCVWQQLATDNILWQGLCRSQWHYASVYSKAESSSLRYRELFLLLDEGTLTFNSNAEQGMAYFISHGLVDDSSLEIAKFIHGTDSLARPKVRQYVESRQEVVDHLVKLQNYANTFLPIALRRFFAKLEAPNDRGSYLQRLLEQFSVRFCQCNPSLAMSVDSVYVMCFSLILLSVDLTSPHVKNKMSKREFIRNTRGAVGTHGHVQRSLEEDLYGSLYDNVFLRGHIADEEKPVEAMCKQQFVPGYLALFL